MVGHPGRDKTLGNLPKKILFSLSKWATSMAHLTDFSFDFFVRRFHKICLPTFYKPLCKKSKRGKKTQIKGVRQVKFNMSTISHPQTDGLTEGVNRIMEDTLRSFANRCQLNWDLLLSLCLFYVSNFFQASNGEAPFFLNSGYHPITPSGLVDTRTRTTADYAQNEQSPCSWLHQREEALMTVKDALASAQARQAFYCNSRRKEANLNVGALVLVHRELLITPEPRDRPSNKLRKKRCKPFNTTEVSTNAFRQDFLFQLTLSLPGGL